MLCLLIWQMTFFIHTLHLRSQLVQGYGGAVITLIGPCLHGGEDWITAGPFGSDILAFSQYGGNIDTSFAVFLPEPWFVPLHLLSTW